MKLRRYKITFWLLWLFILLGIPCFADPVYTQEYSINAVETDTKIHPSSTAVIDTTAKEIRIPRKATPNSIAFLGEGFDYYLVTGTDAVQYSFDGSEMVENRTLLPETFQNPCGVATQRDGLDFLLTEDHGSNYNINYYGFDGSEMALNPAMTLTGQQNVLSVAYISPERMGVLTEDKARIYAFNGTDLISQQEFVYQNPVAIASDGFMNVVVATEEKVDYYGFSGTDYVNIPAMSFALGANEDIRGVGVNANGVFTLKGQSVTGYEYDGAVIKESAAITKTGFVDAVAMAVHPENNDLLILDRVDPALNNYRMRYLMYDGSELIENEELSVDITNLVMGGRYIPSAELVFKEGILATPFADYMRIRAYTVIPENTQITFYVANTASSYPTNTTWKESWKVSRAVGGEATVYKSVPNGGGFTWEVFGTIDKSFPNVDAVDTGGGSEEVDVGDITYNNGDFEFPKGNDVYLADLWTEMPSAESRVYFKAVLETTDTTVSPKIVVPQLPNFNPALADTRAVLMEAVSQPGVVTVKQPGFGLTEVEIDKFIEEFGTAPLNGWVYTTTPEIEWEYGGNQTAYQVVVMGRKDNSNFVIAYDSGKISGSDGLLKKAIIPTSVDPSVQGALVAADTYDFAVTVRVWNQGGFASDFGEPVDFKVLAFDRPRIISISSPPEGQTSPDPDVPSTHALIRRDTPASSLPKTKTGSLMALKIDTIGPISRGPDDPKRVARFYGDTPGGDIETEYGDSTVKSILGNGTATNEWTFEFWSSAPIELIPDNTTIKGQFLADAYQGGGAIMLIPPYAAGVAFTDGTVYQDWTVILQGSEE